MFRTALRSALSPAAALMRTACPPPVAARTLARTFSASTRAFAAAPAKIAQVQQPAPDFKARAVVNGKFADVSLSSYRGKYVVLFFYPLDFTFVCPTEITAFNDRAADFAKLNAQVVAVSVDSEHSHLAWTNVPRRQGGLGDTQIPLVSDITKSIAESYGVLLKDKGIALRGTFIIDDKGILRQSTINDLPIGRNVDETLRLVEALQFSDKNGEVCPANWKKGSQSMKPDPVKSKEYFSAVHKE